MTFSINAKQPFYSSTQFIMLEEIATGAYYEFIEKNFSINGRSIATEAIRYILDWTKQHTYYTQSLCNTVHSNDDKAINVEYVKIAYLQILQLNKSVYLQYRRLLTDNQWNFLIAVAKEQQVKQISSIKFISKYDIGTPASVKRIVASLCNKELLVENTTKEGTFYFVFDVFFSRWLEHAYS